MADKKAEYKDYVSSDWFKCCNEIHADIIKKARASLLDELREGVKERIQYHRTNADEAGRVREWNSFNSEGPIVAELNEVLSVIEGLGGKK